ncbi:SWR1-complex protein 5 [Coccidioides immitis H538.4]|uniref:SWR1-complex protein 5 n=1 Tax=Coccidioides immitis H538.4 TaxID=396776 RepID=A0A0J8U5J1_COCIT|nr:SWR1-complex protein 5 [Coccidioides immitis H538.4]
MSPTLPTPADGTSTPEDGTTLLSLDDGEQYNSEEDSDFDINAPAEDEEEDATDAEPDGRPRKRRRLTPTRVRDEDGDEYVVEGALDSGDEATIRKAKEKREKRRRKGKKVAGDQERDGNEDEDEDEDDFDFEDDDEGGGRGGFVRTRAMKMKMQEEQKPLARIDGATVDVDALWAQMNAPDFGKESTPSMQEKQSASEDASIETLEDGKASNLHLPPKTPARGAAHPSEETITIKRTYKFAGEVITEKKEVELDWAAYVDKEGIKDELDVHSRAKEGYMGRVDFLNRVEAKREEDRRNVRLKGRRGETKSLQLAIEKKPLSQVTGLALGYRELAPPASSQGHSERDNVTISSFVRTEG